MRWIAILAAVVLALLASGLRADALESTETGESILLPEIPPIAEETPAPIVPSPSVRDAARAPRSPAPVARPPVVVTPPADRRVVERPVKKIPQIWLWMGF
jgi:hypothetical protein